jgi:hypothetical protein
MYRKWFRIGVPFALLLGALNLVLFTHITGAQDDYPLENCRANAFSTEEDFMMQRGEPYDGNPYISDGDLLNFTGQVCARNADLLRVFDVRDDLGLDGVDVLDVDKRIVAFSTEIDSPTGKFTAGDLLVTDGTIIPNLALVFPFGIGYDIGLDEMKFMGKIEDILRFIEFAREVGPEGLLGGRLQEVLKEFNVDIWFTIEATYQADQRLILDGDLLSASGNIIKTQDVFFDASIPAGIPKRGVDFGLDAFAVSRDAIGNPEQFRIYFSTEILYRGRRAFTDGDILRLGGSVARTNEALVAPFFPAARFLGLDALWIGFRNPPPTEPNITHLCGRSEGLFDSTTGLFQDTFTEADGDEVTVPRPCGLFVPIDGYLPATGVTRFRVAYREVSDPVPPVGIGPAIQTQWILNDRDNILSSCILNSAHTLSTDPDGWMDAAAYLGAWNGDVNTDFCPNPEVRLAVWNTTTLPAGPAVGHDREDHFIVWLEWEDTASVLHREPVDHHVQLDNTAPEIPAYPNGLQLRLTDGVTVVPACGESPRGTGKMQVWADFADTYYENFQISIKGGLPPTTVSYPTHNYYDDPGSPAVFQNTDDTGTTPDGSLQHVQDIDMFDLNTINPGSYVACCYLLEMWVYDRAILHSFNGSAVNQVNSHHNYTFITFAAAP